MNGTNRLYRSTSEAMIGGVAAGLGNYFKIDPTIVRALFVILTLFTGGAFIVPYLILWFLIPTAGSTASTPGGVVQENLNEIGAKLRGGWNVPGNGGSGAGTGGSAPTNGNSGNQGTPGNSANFSGPAETPNGGPANGAPNTGTSIQTQHHQGYSLLPLVLIVIGSLVLLSHMGIAHVLFGAGLWPLFLIGIGFYLLTRRNRWNKW